jgi:hypothetical protein
MEVGRKEESGEVQGEDRGEDRGEGQGEGAPFNNNFMKFLSTQDPEDFIKMIEEGKEEGGRKGEGGDLFLLQMFEGERRRRGTKLFELGKGREAEGMLTEELCPWEVVRTRAGRREEGREGGETIRAVAGLFSKGIFPEYKVRKRRRRVDEGKEVQKERGSKMGGGKGQTGWERAREGERKEKGRKINFSNFFFSSWLWY